MGPRRILLADDSPSETERIRRSLEVLSDVEIVCVGDGATAVAEAKQGRFDLVLCDYEMPGLNGLQVVRLLRATWSRHELPILMLTVRDDAQTKALSLRQGANDYVTKPVDSEELLARVMGQLDLKAAVEANIEARVRMLEERKLATIGRLAAGLAHDLNTPAQFTADNLVFLQKAVGASSELLSRARDWLVAHPGIEPEFADEFLAYWQDRRVSYLLAEAPKALEESLNGIMRIARTVRELKEFAGLPDGHWAPADINRAIENTVVVSRQLWSSVANVSLELAADLPPLACDVTALKQAFFDILMAAVERAPSSSGLPRSSLQIVIRSKPWEEGIEISFSDDGVAPSAQLSRHGGSASAERSALERASVESSVAERSVAGSALERGDRQGLGVAYSVVVGQHQGQLHSESMLAQGATVVVRLREGQQSRRARGLAPSPPPSPASTREVVAGCPTTPHG